MRKKQVNILFAQELARCYQDVLQEGHQLKLLMLQVQHLELKDHA